MHVAVVKYRSGLKGHACDCCDVQVGTKKVMHVAMVTYRSGLKGRACGCGDVVRTKRSCMWQRVSGMSHVSLTLVKEWRFIRIIYYYYDYVSRQSRRKPRPRRKDCFSFVP